MPNYASHLLEDPPPRLKHDNMKNTSKLVTLVTTTDGSIDIIKSGTIVANRVEADEDSAQDKINIKYAEWKFQILN